MGAEKLRRFGEHLRGGGSFSTPDAADLIKSGADEIERLRTALVRIASQESVLPPSAKYVAILAKRALAANDSQRE